MNALRRRLLVLACVSLLCLPSFAQVLFTDNLTTGSNWLSSSNSGVTATGGALSVTAGRHVLTYFMPAQSQQTIGLNQSIQVTFDINFSSVGNSLAGFRVGLFDSNNAARPANGIATGFQPYDGYLFSMNPNPTAGAAEKNSLTLRVRQPLTSAYDELMNSFNSSSPPTHTTYVATGTASPSTPEPTLQAFPTGKALQGTYTVSRTTGASLTFSFSLTGEGLVNFTRSYVVSSPSTYSFDAFALFSLSSNGSNFAIDNVTVTAVPEPSTYAACAGAAVLGLAFWRRRRAAAKALAA